MNRGPDAERGALLDPRVARNDFHADRAWNETESRGLERAPGSRRRQRKHEEQRGAGKRYRERSRSQIGAGDEFGSVHALQPLNRTAYERHSES